jgi:hypothetical protein
VGVFGFPIELLSAVLTPILLAIFGVFAILFALLYLRRQAQRDRFDRDLKLRELHIANLSIERAEDREKDRGDSAEGLERTAGFVFLNMRDEYKSLFADAINGFAEYARLKGYSVQLAADCSLPGKVGLKIVILDSGITVSTSTVRRDVDEYIAKLRNSDDLDDMPVVTDPLEHERLKSALKMRFSFVKHEADLQAAASEAYRNMLSSVQAFSNRGISHTSAAPAQSIQLFLQNEGNRMARDTFSAENSPGAAVGNRNTASIEGSSIIIGSTIDERQVQTNSLKELAELIKSSSMADVDKHTAIRNIENAQEELSDSEKPDTSSIGKWLNRVKAILQTASVSAEIVAAAKPLLAMFGISF